MPIKPKPHLWLLAIGFPLIALTVFLVPFQVLQPGKAQHQDILLVTLELKRWAPLLAALSAIASLTLSRRIRRWPAYLATVLTFAAGTLSFINQFEMMFAPIDQATFANSSDANLDDDDMLLAIKLGGESRAYPVRTLAYHHLINDTAGNVPILATY
ncbi:MAG: DUF3179 domain-containing protein [Acidobacteria bacterium]|nr:DUF3179 domain-containing protein [Acidobacteriota bacterium]